MQSVVIEGFIYVMLEALYTKCPYCRGLLRPNHVITRTWFVACGTWHVVRGRLVVAGLL